jgi:cell division protein FtsQ
MAARNNSARARALVLPRPAWRGNLELARLAPSGRSLAVGFALIAVASGLYAAARTTGILAIRTVEVRGVGPADAARVRAALATLRGTSLLAVSGDDVRGRVARLPEVAGVTFDRAYPHTLRLRIVPERPAVVVRRGAESWLVSERGRAIRKIPRGHARMLPRVWVSKTTEIARGATLDASGGGTAAQALAVLRKADFSLAVRTVHADHGTLTFALRDGRELRFGSVTDLRLKLAVAQEALDFVQSGAYLDVSVPQRPVSGSTLKSKVEP